MDCISLPESVAGVISLPIQVTQILFDFYSAYRRMKPDVIYINNKLGRLLTKLENLKQTLEGRKRHPDDHETLDLIYNEIQLCKEFIDELFEENEKITVNMNSTRSLARTIAHQVTYPFR
jgi:hypothetical protein